MSSPVDTMSNSPVGSPVKTMFYGPCTRVFWDLVDFPFPEGLDPVFLYQSMGSILKNKFGFVGELSIMTYVDQETFPDELCEAYEKAGFTITYLAEGHRCRLMFIDIAWWAKACFTDTIEPISFMVISNLDGGRRHFLDFLESWVYARYIVLLATPHQLPLLTSKLLTLTFDSLSTSLLNGGNPILTKDLTDSGSQAPPVPTMSSPPVASLDEPMSYGPVGSPVETIRRTVALPCTRVFWDMMGFSPFRSGLYCPSTAYNLLRDILKDMGSVGELSVMAYVQKGFISEKIRVSYEEAGFTIIYHPQEVSTYARVHNMLVDIVSWALESPANYFEPLNLMVISENVKEDTVFLSALEVLDERYFNVLLAVPHDLKSSSGLHTVSFDWLSERFLGGSFSNGLSLNHMWNHKWKSREENAGFSDGLASLYPQAFGGSQITVFWDVQDCPTGDTKIGPALRDKGYAGDVFIRPYVDGDHQWSWVTDTVIYALNVDPLTRVATKDAKVTRMLLDLLFWAMNNDDIPQNFMLISKTDSKCNSVVKALEHRGFNLILGPSDDFSLPLPLKSPPGREMLINRSVKLQGRKLPEVWKLPEGRERGMSMVAVFWLVGEDCPSDPKLLEWRITSTIVRKGYDGVMSITAYVDAEKFTRELEDVYSKTGMGVNLIRENYGLSTIDRMSWDMIMRTNTFDGPSDFLVITKPFRDLTFDGVLEDFERRGLNVLIEQPDYMVAFGSEVWSAKILLDGRIPTWSSVRSLGSGSGSC